MVTILPNGDKLVEPEVPKHVLLAFQDRYHRSFDLAVFDGEWGNTARYKHSHVQCLWEGWRDGYIALSVINDAQVKAAWGRYVETSMNSDNSNLDCMRAAILSCLSHTAGEP